jgi:hypothetical protein
VAKATRSVQLTVRGLIDGIVLIALPVAIVAELLRGRFLLFFASPFALFGMFAFLSRPTAEMLGRISERIVKTLVREGLLFLICFLGIAGFWAGSSTMGLVHVLIITFIYCMISTYAAICFIGYWVFHGRCGREKK